MKFRLPMLVLVVLVLTALPIAAKQGPSSGQPPANAEQLWSMIQAGTEALALKVADASTTAPANDFVYSGWIDQLRSSVEHRDQEAVLIVLRSMQGLALDFLPEEGVLSLTSDLAAMLDLAYQLDSVPTTANPSYRPQPYRSVRESEVGLWSKIQVQARVLGVKVFSGGPLNRLLFDGAIDDLRRAIALGDQKLAEQALIGLHADPALLAGTVGVLPVLNDSAEILRLVETLDPIPGLTGGAERAPTAPNSQNPFLTWIDLQNKTHALSTDVYVAATANQVLYQGPLDDLRRAIVRMDQVGAQHALDSLRSSPAILGPGVMDTTARVEDMRKLLFQMPLVASLTFKGAQPLAANATCQRKADFRMTYRGELTDSSFTLIPSSGPRATGRLAQDGSFDGSGTHDTETVRYVGKLEGGPGTAMHTDSFARGCSFTWDIVFTQAVGPFPEP